MQAGPTPVATPWYRQFWPWFIIGLPACAVVASIATLIIAASGDDTLVVADYNRIEELTALSRARDAGAQALGLSADLSMGPDEGRIRVELSALARPGVRWRPDRLRLNLRHPTRQTEDRSTILVRRGSDSYVGSLPAAPTDRVYVELLPDAEPDDVRPDWRLAAEWLPGRVAIALSPASRP